MQITNQEHRILKIYKGGNLLESDPSLEDVQDVIDSFKAASSIQTLEKLTFLDLQESILDDRVMYSVCVSPGFRLSFLVDETPEGEDQITVMGISKKSVLAK